MINICFYMLIKHNSSTIKLFKIIQIVKRTCMDKPSMLDLAHESDAAFRAQFDPSSESFHKGLTTPVPLHGDRVPESMSTMYP